MASRFVKPDAEGSEQIGFCWVLGARSEMFTGVAIAGSLVPLVKAEGGRAKTTKIRKKKFAFEGMGCSLASIDATQD